MSLRLVQNLWKGVPTIAVDTSGKFASGVIAAIAADIIDIGVTP